MASSLGLFRSKPAPLVFTDGALFSSCAHRVLPSERAWRPSRSPSGKPVLLAGWIDNLDDLSETLGVSASDPAALYGAAHDKWGDDADLHVIGDYCALVDDAENKAVRLARSPWKAPPLHYSCDSERVVAASVPRVLHACGVPANLDRRRLIDNHFLNLTSDRGWYEGCYRVKLASSVHITPGKRAPRVYYDMLAPRETRLPRAQDYVEAADALLREACKATLGDARTPGMMLSGGLDSSNVAARVLDCLPPDRTLKSFTFRPLETYDQPDPLINFSDDGPAVMRFAAMHPRLEPYFSRNEGLAFDAQWDRMFLAMGTAPDHLPNMYHFHSLAEEAQRQGCDRVLWADFGNKIFSGEGLYAYHEFLVTGRWRQLWLALKHRPFPQVPRRRLLWRFALSPLIPDWLWRAQRRLRGLPMLSVNAQVGSLRREVIEEYGLEEQARADGALFLRDADRSRQDEIAVDFGRDDSEFSDTLQGFEQIYGLDFRDVTAYRPLIEFCLGLPTDMFLKDGQSRWLARELGRGLMPEEQRLNPKQGLHSADWHQRMTPRLESYRRELEEAAQDPDLAAIIDFDKLFDTLDNWPEQGSYRQKHVLNCLMATSRAVLTKRFTDFVSGKNR